MALNEKIDVYSLGNNFYSILTGLWIHYDVQDDTIVQVSSNLRHTESQSILAVICVVLVQSRNSPSLLCNHTFVPPPHDNRNGL